MAIPKNAKASGGKYISDPGEYAVEITDVQFGKSKKGDPMVTVNFATMDDKSIRAFFVQKHAFMMNQLGLLKVACDEEPTCTTEKLLGKKCGILVELGKPNDAGVVFAQIAGYGKLSDLEEKPQDLFEETDAIPF